jgi:hypothetical protein
MSVTLRPYQREAADKLVNIVKSQRIAYLSGMVRTGKTMTVLAAVQSIGYASVLIVTKKKAIKSIEMDRDAMGLTDIVTVTNYEQLPKFRSRSYGLLIVDEAHGVGAFPKPSKRYRDLQAIHRSAVLLMSGTPSPESYSQLYHQFALGGSASPWAGYRNFYGWAKEYVRVKQKYVGTGQTVNDYSDADKARIFRDIGHLVVKMTQEQAGFETQIEEHVHRVKMRPITYRLARRIMKDGVIGSPRCRAVVADTGAKVMSKVQQIFGGAVITERHGAVKFDDSKARFVAGRFGDTKHAILYKFTAEGDMLKAAYAGRWTDSPEVFNSTSGMTYIGQVQASREGVNLSSAEHLVFVGIDFAALSYLQGRDRASYLGRTSPPQVHWVFADGGIEPDVYRTVRGKVDYTVQHFKYDRKRLSSHADQAIRGGRMDGAEADPREQGGVPRPVATAPRRGAVGGGQRTERQTEQGAGVSHR